MTEVGVHEAKTHLSELLRRVATGDEIVILRGGRPAAKLVPVEDKGKREFGFDRRWKVPDDFDDPLPDDVVRLFDE